MDLTDKKKPFWGSFWIADRDSCEKAIRNGGIAALVSAGITAVLAIAGFFTSSSNKDLAYMLDPLGLVDVGLLVVLAIFVFRKSRVASTLLVIYFLLGKALTWYELGKAQGLLISVIFFLYYVTAMRGTYRWHATYEKAADAAAPA